MTFKSQETVVSEEQLQPFQLAVANGEYAPLFADRGGVENGGLAVLHHGGIVVEIRSPEWAVEPMPAHLRAAKLLVSHGDGVSRFTPSDTWDARDPSLGSETEIMVCTSDGNPWHLLPDGRTLRFPDGSTAPADDYAMQPEALVVMGEYGTRPVRGHKAYAREVKRTELRVERMLHHRDLVAPPLSEYPDVVSEELLSSYPYIQLVTGHMPHVLEFAASMSWQQHVQMKSPEAMLAALNDYQAVQALTTLLTHGAPIRDGSFETTLQEHYERHPGKNAEALLREYGADSIPADWRELSRKFGSPSGGTYEEAAPHTLDGVLDDADRQLRSGEIVSAVRTLGWHTDRFRLDKGTGEICNLGKAGGNLYKVLAVQEFVGKLLVALQEFRTASGKAGDPLFSMDDSPADRQLAVDVGRRNSMRVAMLGKRAQLETPDGRGAVPPIELYRRAEAFIAAYGPEPVSPQSSAENRATLHPAPRGRQYKSGDAQKVLADFYRPGSPWTHAEALTMAHRVDRSLPIGQLLVANARIRSNHVYKLYNEFQSINA